MNSKQEIFRERLGALGFDAVRFASLDAGVESGLRAWLDGGRQADMQWMERTAEKRLNPQLVLPGARSVVMLGVNYWSEALRTRGGGAPPPGVKWARYALHEDYHDTVKPGLVAAGRTLEEIYGLHETDYRYYVDTGPVLERGWAARAGIGFIGKNAMLISRQHGNWMLLAAILTRVEFQPDDPISRKAPTVEAEAENGVGLLCGKCTRCLDACPTDAFPAPGVVDA
ncbi:MAG: QueG-associated DUF1730 domain-containing protein, partial [Opitutaceae bacterium]